MLILEKKVYVYSSVPSHKPAESAQEAFDAVVKQNREAAIATLFPDDVELDVQGIVHHYPKIQAVVSQADLQTINENAEFIEKHGVVFHQ